MAEPTVPVPVSLIERILVNDDELDASAAEDELRALLLQPTPTAVDHEHCDYGEGYEAGMRDARAQQPTPTAEAEVDVCLYCLGAGYHDGGDMRDDEPCSACRGTGLAAPPNITDMAPGTVVLDAYAAVCIRDEQGWLRVTPSVSGGQHRHRPYGVLKVLVDPSMIRDVTPPKEQP